MIARHLLFEVDARNALLRGATAIDLKRGIDRALQVAMGCVREQSRSIQSHRENVQVATISAHDDPRIGELVAEVAL